MKFWYNQYPIEILGQRYHLKRMLGSGGMAEVCLAWDKREEREVAIKILKAEDLDQETLNRFMKEGVQVAGWHHPHILCIYESLQAELLDPAQSLVLFYIVMEYARGGDLHKRLTPGKPFPLADTFALFRQLCAAVQYAHEHGVVHRDLKPMNILFRRPLTGPEEVVLSDFGLAVHMDATHYSFVRGGTLAYMAPEQFAGHISPTNDIYALGVILYQLCTGHLPFRRLAQGLPHLGNVPLPKRLSLLNPDFPLELDEIVLRALLEVPAERYHNAREFWETLEQALISIAQTYPLLAPEAWQIDGETRSLGDSFERKTASRRAGEQASRRAGSPFSFRCALV